jgi:eukaryotic-like serine/threonine-protein kinase
VTSEETIFAAALEKGVPAERTAYLQSACGGNAALRRRVEALLQAHESADPLLDVPPAFADPTVDQEAEPGLGPTLADEVRERADGTATHATPQAPFANDLLAVGRTSARPITEGPGTRIGPYKLLQKIGEGGMGVVYMAEQEKPVRRRVALKIIKPGMDTDQVVARFEVERQALALMDHPNIACVFDAGCTESGRPFFVMELVNGISINQHCDAATLSTRDRLALFMHVCRAIQHAHQKGVIHRDIKPANVLVTLIDGEPVPKVIDFGVARAVDQRLTERSLFTQFGALVGTLEYMSPEQAAMAGQDVDTRTDVYSLGVLLYELLTGTTPLERTKLHEMAYAEILRRIKEDEPPNPSTRLGESREAMASVAAYRRTEPARLTKMVRGELDWIVMRALEKDRSRRYETASGFARDIERYLDDEPVEAGPPAASYRLRKFAHRYRALLSTAAGFAGLLVLGIGLSTWQAVRATQAERLAGRRLDDVRRANVAATLALAETRKAQAATTAALERSDEDRRRAEAVSRFLVETLSKPDPRQDGRNVKVVDLLDRARAKLDAGFDGPPSVRWALLNALGETYWGLGQTDNAVKTHELARSARQTALGPDHPDTLESSNHLAVSYLAAGRTADAVALHETTLKLRESRLGLDHPDTLASRDSLASAYRAAGRTAEGVALHKTTLKLRESKLGPDHPSTLVSRNNLAEGYVAAGRTAEGIALHETNLKQWESKRGPDHPDTLQSRTNLASAYLAAGRAAEAVALYETNLKLMESKLGPDHPDTLATRNNLAAAYDNIGRTADAVTLHETNLKQVESKLGPDHPGALIGRNNLAQAYRAAGRAADAVALHERNLKLTELKLGPDHPNTLAFRSNLAQAYLAAGLTAEGIALHETNLKQVEAKLGPDHPYTLSSLNNLTAAYQARGDHARAEPLLRELLKAKKRKLGAEHPEVAGTMSALGLTLLKQEKFAEAEPLLGECLRIREAKIPDDWSTFNTRSMLGGSLLGQKKFAEAEPLLVAAYEGLKAREVKIPPLAKVRLVEAGERVVQLYEFWGMPAKAAEWRVKVMPIPDPQRGLPPAGELPADPFVR